MPESPGHIFPLVLARFLVAVGVRSGGTYPLGVPNRSTQVSAKPTPVKIQTVALLPDIFWFIKIAERYGAQAQPFQKPPPRPGWVPCRRAAGVGGAGQVIRGACRIEAGGGLRWREGRLCPWVWKGLVKREERNTEKGGVLGELWALGVENWGIGGLLGVARWSLVGSDVLWAFDF